jgi:hypothetical protein
MQSKENTFTRLGAWVSSGALLMGQAAPAMAAKTENQNPIDRTVLPLREPEYPTSRLLDVREATPPSHFAVRPPAGAPNVLVVLVDDLGFGGTSSFGGPVPTEAFDRIAQRRFAV